MHTQQNTSSVRNKIAAIPRYDEQESAAMLSNLDAEKFVLGAILTDPDAFPMASGVLSADDFSLEKHKRIFLRMGELFERNEKIDRVTLANELTRQGQLQSVDGLSYLVSLDDGLPVIHNLVDYIEIVREKSRVRRIAALAVDVRSRALSGEPSSSLVQSTEQALLDMADSGRTIGPMSTQRILTYYPGGVEHFLDPSKAALGLQTGFIKFDEMTGGLREGDLFILAARPAMGKSSLALGLGFNIATHKTKPKGVALFSLEMSKESLMQRLVCLAASVDLHRFRSGYLNHDERKALYNSLSVVAEAPIYFDDSAGANVMEIHSKLRRLMREADLGLVIVDYLQLMTGGKRIESRQQEVSNLSRGFKLMAKELKLPFVVLSQLSRATETRVGDHRPILSDLRESGSIEQDADMVGFIFREEIYRPDKESLRGIAELILAKQRNGPIGRIKLAFLSRFTRFENLATDTGEDTGAFD